MIVTPATGRPINCSARRRMRKSRECAKTAVSPTRCSTSTYVKGIDTKLSEAEWTYRDLYVIFIGLVESEIPVAVYIDQPNSTKGCQLQSLIAKKCHNISRLLQGVFCNCPRHGERQVEPSVHGLPAALHKHPHSTNRLCTAGPCNLINTTARRDAESNP